MTGLKTATQHTPEFVKKNHDKKLKKKIMNTKHFSVIHSFTFETTPYRTSKALRKQLLL
jgi:hypothetical protein